MTMPEYLYQVAYTPESLAAQIKNPQDRLQIVGKQLTEAVGAKILAGGYSYGKYDVSVIVDAPDDVTMAAVALAIAAAGAVKAAKTTPAERLPVGGCAPEGPCGQRPVPTCSVELARGRELGPRTPRPEPFPRSDRSRESTRKGAVVFSRQG
jgi:uncharacterized protein with GYD domain